MKYTILYLLGLSLITTSCGDIKERMSHETDILPLRQLVKTNDTVTKTHGSYFLIAGSFNSETKSEQTIKMYALVQGSYRYLEYDIRHVRINTTKDVKVPYLIIRYTGTQKYPDNYVVDQKHFYYDSITLYTSEEYLPEHLLPISIN